MARPRSPESVEAEKLFRSGMKLVDIAKKLGKPDGTVRRWKSNQNWGENKSERSEKNKKEKANVRKRGAPTGNKNAVGAGPPKGSKNALKHGGYSAVYWDVLEPEEQEMIENAPDNEEALLMEQIQLFAVRERRLMKAINKYNAVKGGQYAAGISVIEDKRKFKDDEERALYEERAKEKVESGDRLPGQRQSVQTNTSATIDLIARLERELTNVQSKKTKTIDSLMKYRLENRKLDDAGKGTELVDEWIMGLMGTVPEEGDSS